MGRLRLQAYAARAAPWVADWSSRAQRTRHRSRIAGSVR